MKPAWIVPLLLVLASCSAANAPDDPPPPPKGSATSTVTVPPAPRAKTDVFTTELRLGPPGCEATGRCELLSDLNYTDPSGLKWSAKAGQETDGASIPGFAQPFVGEPFDAGYLAAAVIHDHYCVQTVRPFLATHRVFYDAMRTLKLDRAKAKAMYFAVLVGGPKWFELIPGEVCGPRCLRNARSGGGRVFVEDGKIRRDARYASPRVRIAYEEALVAIREREASLSLDDLDRMAAAAFPDDAFLKNRSEEKVRERDLAVADQQ